MATNTLFNEARSIEKPLSDRLRKMLGEIGCDQASIDREIERFETANLLPREMSKYEIERRKVLAMAVRDPEITPP